MKMKNSSKLSGVKDLRLEAFLDSNRDFEFKKVIDNDSSLIKYEILKQFDSEKRRISILKFNYQNTREQYFISTLKDYTICRENMNLPINMRTHGNEIYGLYFNINKLIKWLDDPRNEILWFPENLAA